MPTYKVTTPAGQAYNVTTPQPANHQELVAHIQKKYGGFQQPAYGRNTPRAAVDPQAAARRAPVSTAVERSLMRTGSLFGDVVPALGASFIADRAPAFGVDPVPFDDYAERQMREAQETEEKIGRTLAPAVPTYHDVLESETPWKTGAVYALENFGDQIPTIASLVGTTFTFGATFPAVAAQLGQRKIRKIALEKYAGRAALQETLLRRGEKVVKDAAKKTKRKGQFAGAMLGSWAYLAPEYFEGVYRETGEMAPLAALGFGAVGASLEMILPRAITRRLQGSSALKNEVIKNVLLKKGMEPSLVRSLGANVAKGTGKGLALEGATEGGQEAIGILAERIVGDNWEALSSEEADRLIESSVRGSLIGGPFGAVGGVQTGVYEHEGRKDAAQFNKDSRRLEELGPLVAAKKTELEVEQAKDKPDIKVLKRLEDEYDAVKLEEEYLSKVKGYRNRHTLEQEKFLYDARKEQKIQVNRAKQSTNLGEFLKAIGAPAGGEAARTFIDNGLIETDPIDTATAPFMYRILLKLLTTPHALTKAQQDAVSDILVEHPAFVAAESEVSASPDITPYVRAETVAAEVGGATPVGGEAVADQVVSDAKPKIPYSNDIANVGPFVDRIIEAQDPNTPGTYAEFIAKLTPEETQLLTNFGDDINELLAQEESRERRRRQGPTVRGDSPEFGVITKAIKEANKAWSKAKNAVDAYVLDHGPELEEARKKEVEKIGRGEAITDTVLADLVAEEESARNRVKEAENAENEVIRAKAEAVGETDLDRGDFFGLQDEDLRQLEEQARNIPLGEEADAFIQDIEKRYGYDARKLVTDVINNRSDIDPLTEIDEALRTERAQDNPDPERIELLEARYVAEVNRQDDIRYSRVGKSPDQEDMFGVGAQTYDAPTVQITKPIIAKNELLDGIDPNGKFQLANLNPETNEAITSPTAAIHGQLSTIDKKFSSTGFIQNGMYIDARDLGRLINERGTASRRAMVENGRVRGEKITAAAVSRPAGDLFAEDAQTYEQDIAEIERDEAGASEDTRTADEIALAIRRIEIEADRNARRDQVNRLASDVTPEQRAEITKLAGEYSEGYRDGGTEGEGGTYRALREVLGTEYSLDVLAANIHLALMTGTGPKGGLKFFLDKEVDKKTREPIKPTSEAERKDIFESIERIKKTIKEDKAKTKAIAKAKKLLSFGFLPEQFGPNNIRDTESDSLFQYTGGVIGLDVYTKLKNRAIRSKEVRARIRELDADLAAVERELRTESESENPNVSVMEGLEKERDALDKGIEEQVRNLDTDAVNEFNYLRNKVEEFENIAAQKAKWRVTEGPDATTDGGRAVKKSVDGIHQMDRASLEGFLTGDISAGDRAIAEQALEALDSEVGQRITELNQEIDVIREDLTQEKATANRLEVITEKERERTRLLAELETLTGEAFASSQAEIEDVLGGISTVTYSAESEQISEGAARRHNLLVKQQAKYVAAETKLSMAPNKVNLEAFDLAKKTRDEAAEEFRNYARKYSDETKEQIRLNEEELKTLRGNKEGVNGLVRGLTEEEAEAIATKMAESSAFAAESLVNAGVKPATPIYNQARKLLFQAAQAGQGELFPVRTTPELLTMGDQAAQARASVRNRQIPSPDAVISAEEGLARITKYIEDARAKAAETRASAIQILVNDLKTEKDGRIADLKDSIALQEDSIQMDQNIDVEQGDFKLTELKDTLRAEEDSAVSALSSDVMLERKISRALARKVPTDAAQVVYAELARLKALPILEGIDPREVERQINRIKDATYDSAGRPQESIRSGLVPDPTTVERTQEILTARFESEILDHVTIVPSPQAAGLNNVAADVAGSVIRGKVYLFTNNIQRGNELGVLLHELGAHVGMKDMVGRGSYAALVKRIKQFAALNDGSPEAQIAKVAVEKVKSAVEASKTESDEIGLSETVIDDELLAYFVEEAVNKGINPVQESKFKTRLGLWFKRFIAGTKNYLGRRFGAKFKKLPETAIADAEIITAQEIVDLAYGAAKFAMRTPQSKLTPLESVMTNSLASLAPDLEAEVFGRVDDIVNNSVPWTQEFANTIPNKVSKLTKGLQKTYYNLIGVRDIADVVRRTIPPLADAIDRLYVILGMRRQKIDQSRQWFQDILFTIMRDLEEAGTTEAQKKKFNKIAHDSTIEKIDLRDNNNPEVTTTRLYKDFKELPAELQETYIKIVNAYEVVGNRLVNYYSGVLGRTLTATDKQQLGFVVDARGRIVPYLPLVRDGNYWVDFTVAGVRYSTSHDSRADARRAVTELVKSVEDGGAGAVVHMDIYAGHEVDGSGVYERTTQSKEITYDGTQIQEVIKKLDEVLPATTESEAEYKKRAIEQVKLIHLQFLPSNAMEQQFRPRAGTPGYNGDVLQNFAYMGLKFSNELALLETNAEFNAAMGTVNAIAAQYANKVSGDIASVLESLKKRDKFLRNPTPAPWAAQLAYAGYGMLLLGNVSAAAVNFTQLPTVGYGILAGEFGHAKTTSAIMSAFQMYFKGGKDDNTRLTVPIIGEKIPWTLADRTIFTGKNMEGARGKVLRRLIDTAYATNAVRRTSSQELQDMRTGDVDSLTGNWVRSELLLSWLFQNSERANREILLLAAFNLATDSGIYTEEQAIDKAVRVVDRANGPALAEAGSAYMTDGWGKVFGTFKRFAISQIFLQSQLVRDAFTKMGDYVDPSLPPGSPTAKQLARRQLFAISIPAYAFAGIKGLPLFGAAQLLYTLTSSVWGDDDTEDFDLLVRGAVGDMGYRGPLSHFLNVDFASRTGFYGLAFRDNPYRRAEVGLIPYMLESTLGPVYGVTVGNITRAQKQWEQGQSVKAITTMTPAPVRNLWEAINNAKNKVKTANGHVLLEDISAYNSFMHALGFKNDDLANLYAKRSFLADTQRKILDTRRSLLTRNFAANLAGDYAEQAKIAREIREFNGRDLIMRTDNIISSATMRRSMKAFYEKLNTSYLGLSIPQNALPGLLEYAGYER